MWKDGDCSFRRQLMPLQPQLLTPAPLVVVWRHQQGSWQDPWPLLHAAMLTKLTLQRRQMVSVSMAAVTNHYKPSSLSRAIYFLAILEVRSLHWVSLDWNWGDNVSSGDPRAKSVVLPFPASGSHPHIWAQGPFSIIKASKGRVGPSHIESLWSTLLT